MNTAYVFLIDVANLNKNGRCSVTTPCNAIVISFNDNFTQYNVDKIGQTPIGDVVGMASKKYNLRLGNFTIDTATREVKGTEHASLQRLKDTKCVTLANIKRPGRDDVIGYIVTNKEGKTARITKAQIVNGDNAIGKSIQNMKYVKNDDGKVYVAALDVDLLPTFMMVAAPNKVSQTVANKEGAGVKGKETPEVEAKKKALLTRLKGTKIGNYLNGAYSYDCIKMLLNMAKLHQRYDYLLDPRYNKAQMGIIQLAYMEGYDISKLNDPGIPAMEMDERLVRMRNHISWNEPRSSK